MFIIETYHAAVFMCIITMLCWGSWANTQKISGKKWPFQLFYWDYCFGVFALTLTLAFTLGSNGGAGRPFLIDLAQAENSYLLDAFIGGVVFNFANILLVIAIDLAGMAIAFPIGIGAALVIGVITNYLYAPYGNPYILFLGVALIIVAILIDALAYKKVSKIQNKSPFNGIIISLMAGIAMGLFYKFVAQSMSANFSIPEEGKLTPYTALVVFSCGMVVSNFVFNTVNMYRPIKGKAVSFSDYFSLGTAKLHTIGLLGGIIWGVGMSFNIIASEQAGPAIAYALGQGATMVAAFWGIFIWKELKDLPKSKKWMVLAMFLCFLGGLGLIVYSKVA